MDKLPQSKAAKKMKKHFRARFWKEVCDGAKIFFFSGVKPQTDAKSGVTNEFYPQNEILSLVRKVSAVKARPVVFRSTHPHILVDHVENVSETRRRGWFFHNFS